MPSDAPKRDLGQHRPLPSIDVPLLREERMALRSRRLARVAVIVALLAGIAGASFTFVEMSEGTNEPTPEPPDDLAVANPLLGPRDADAALPDAGTKASEAPRPGTAANNQPRFVERPFGKATGFRDAVEQAGLTRNESMTLIAALEGVLDFKRCQPDHVLTVERDASGEIERFGYKASLTQRYEAVRKSDGTLEGRQVEVPVRKVRVQKGGVVTGSLGDALEGLGLRRSLAGVFVEVFEGHVEFAADTRSGDTFRVIVDEEYVDETFLGYGTVHALEFRGQKAGQLRAYWYESDRLEGDFYDPSGRAMHGGWLRTPLRYDHISSPFGTRFHPVLKRRLPHNGIDYAAASGTPVKAAADGTITFAARKGANGNLIAMKHANGYETLYAHLLRFASGIKKGAKVNQREVIGYVGSTGRSTGPHLHFALKHRGRMIDPASQLNGPGRPMPRRALPSYKAHVRRLAAQLDRIPLETPAPVDTTGDTEATEPVDGTEL